MSDERDLVQEPLLKASAKWLGVKLLDGEELERAHSDVILLAETMKAIRRLNPNLTDKEVEAAVREIDKILASVNEDVITEKAQKILGIIRGSGQVHSRQEGRKRSFTLIDFEHPENNVWHVAQEVTYKGSSNREVRFDGVIYCNGIPLVLAEFKSNTDLNTNWLKAAEDLANGYTHKAPAFLATSLINIATDGRQLRYGAVRTPAARYQAWGSTSKARPVEESWAQVKYDWLALTEPGFLLMLAQDLILHVTDKTNSSLMRVIPRWPQAEAAPLAAARALDPDRNKGLFDHFQGSGKTYAMAMAANIVTRKDPKHCVILVVDRLDLLSQHKKDFASSDLRRDIIEAKTASELRAKLKNPNQSGIIITTVHRFDEAGELSKRSDITVMVDEAHRTQSGTLGYQMRQALPNATLLGFTGTPLVDKDKNTYETFGSPDDPQMVLHRYSAADSVRDGTTVRLVVKRSEFTQKLNAAELDEAYNDYAEEQGLSEKEKEDLAKLSTDSRQLLKEPRRIEAICEDVVRYMREEATPAELAGMLVVIDREACVLYADKLKGMLGEDAVTAVISGDKNDPEPYWKYMRDSAEEALVLKDYRDPKKPLKLLVVTSKLLTGFDAKNCGVVFMDKPLKRHTLFQAVTRANRTWTRPSGAEKNFGTVVDYCGIAKNLIAAFDASGDESTIEEFTTPERLIKVFKKALAAAERVLGAGFDWRSKEVIHSANEILHTDTKVWEVFHKNVTRASSIWELMSKEPEVRKEKERMLILLKIMHSYAPDGKVEKELTYAIHGQAVLKLIYDNTGDPTQKKLDDVELTAEKMRELLKHNENPESEVERVSFEDVLKKISERIERRMRGPYAGHYKSIAERLKAFQYTHYEVDAEGSRSATEDLTKLVSDIREVDRVLGEDDSDLDFSLTGTRVRVAPGAVIQNPTTALQDVLREYHPQQMATSVEQVATVLDGLVNRTSYRHLKDDPATEKALKRSLISETQRLGVLPKGGDGPAFVSNLLNYIKIWML